MAAVIKDKFIAEIDEPLVVFLIGGHANNLLAVRDWLWISRAFLSMIRYVTTHPETGCISGHTSFRILPFGIVFQSYWKSFGDLERFARSREEPHLRAWQHFMQTTGKTGSVGIWHETYLVEPGKFEAVYGHTVPYGLAAAGRVVLPDGRNHNARGRLNPQDETVAEEPLVPLPPRP